MAVILHLLQAVDWAQLGRTDVVTNASLDTEGFIHCTDDHNVLLQVANAFYTAYEGGFVVISIDTTLLDSACVWEAPAHLGQSDAHPPAAALFPHVYGPINCSAVINVEGLQRNSAGRFTGFVSR